ncbi:MAG: DUF3298 domain-containing protein [Chitinophagales bacterium]|nr:DUF3298 domain-containing protein [Chitinophagales bacterium]
MKWLYLVLFSCLLASCDNDAPQQKFVNQSDVAVDNNTYYKRYSGTIAGQPVVLHLSSDKGALSGSYYYVKQGKPIGIYFSKDTTIADGYLVAEPSATREDEREAIWKIKLKDNTIIGKWTSPDGSKTYDINLKEEYPTGSYQLSIWEKEDSIRYKADKPEPAATIAYKLLRGSSAMKNEDVQFIEKLIMHELGADSLNAITIEDCVKKQIDNYGKWYRGILAEEPDSNLGESWNNYYSGVAMDVIFNDNNWLVMEMSGSEYTGGAHGNYGVSYMNIDMQQKRVWNMEDVMTVDSNKLNLLLDAEARRYFAIAATESFEDRLLTDKVIPNGNICITPTGINFVYNPYEIASYADGIITLFLPYSQLKDLLKPEFKQRMGIN